MNNTRRQIIETAFLLFLKKGFKAVRLSDIERAAENYPAVLFIIISPIKKKY